MWLGTKTIFRTIRLFCNHETFFLFHLVYQQRLLFDVSVAAQINKVKFHSQPHNIITPFIQAPQPSHSSIQKQSFLTVSDPDLEPGDRRASENDRLSHWRHPQHVLQHRRQPVGYQLQRQEAASHRATFWESPPGQREGTNVFIWVCMNIVGTTVSLKYPFYCVMWQMYYSTFNSRVDSIKFE